MGILNLKLAGGDKTMIYPKDDFVPATYTVLMFRWTTWSRPSRTSPQRV